jgi:phage terminase small subunit
MQRKTLTKKQKAFADEVLKTGNGTQSALKTYDTKDYFTAAAISTENLKKPQIMSYLQEHLEKAKNVVIQLLEEENPKIRLEAAKDVIDRCEGRATQRQEHTGANGGAIIIQVPQAVSERFDVK